VPIRTATLSIISHGYPESQVSEVANFLALRQRLLASTDTDYYTRWARQCLGGGEE
jgi:hypothetical protein